MDNYKELFTRQLSSIECLARRLLDRKYESARDLWAIQVDLARLQIGIREEIAKEKSIKEETKRKIDGVAKRREEGWKEALRQLQAELKCSEMRVHINDHALVLAKQFGDALAWLFLKGDEKKLSSLGINKPNPPIPTGLSLQAMLAVAESYANAGAGFPIIHDITNCLRVGDLTFVDLLKDDDEPLTIEVKARTLGIEGDKANLQVTIYAIAHSSKFIAASDKLRKIPVEIQGSVSTAETPVEETAEGASDRPKRGHDDRLARQVKRMSQTKALQAAQHGEAIEKMGDDTLRMPLLPVRLNMRHSWFHWKVIRELAQRAKVQGYATRVVDDAFFYAATYTDSPAIYPWSSGVNLPYADEITGEVKATFPFCADAKNNSICFKSTWDYLSGDVPINARPFFLYELPADMRLDIMWRRLSIIVYINIGKIVEALQRSGISAKVPRTEEELGRYFIPVKYKEILADGSEVNIQGASLSEFAAKIAFEFMSLQGFLECVSQTMHALVEIAKTKGDAEMAAADA